MRGLALLWLPGHHQGRPCLRRHHQRRPSLRRAAVEIAEAPAWFVDDDENLEPGERCARSLWATDDGALLAAGALVERDGRFDLWLGDSCEPGVEQNQQLKGAVPLALELLVAYLEVETEATTLRAVPPHQRATSLRDGPRCDTAARVALERLGFVEDDGDDALVLDAHVAPARLTELAMSGSRPARDALRLLGLRRTWPLAPGPLATPSGHARRCFYVAGALSEADADAFRRRAPNLDYSDDEDSVDGLPERHALLVDRDVLLEPTLGARALAVGRGVAARAGFAGAEVSAFLRVYGARDRARLKPHFDAFAAATAVVDLAPDAHSGHYFVQSGPHVSSQRRAVFSGRDALVHDAVLLHGVADVDDGTRTSLVFWFHAEADADATDPDVLFASAAASGDPEPLYAAAAGLGHANALARLGSLAEDRGDDDEAAARWRAAALRGHAAAAAALDDVLGGSTIWRDLANHDPFEREEPPG